MLYGFTRLHTRNGLGPKNDFLVLSNHSDAYLEGFLGQERYLNAPMLAWARENAGAATWSWISENRNRLSEQQKEVLAFNEAHGVTAGVTIAFKDAVRRNKGAIALTARESLSQRDVDEVWEKCGHEINALTNVIHLKITSLPWPWQKRRLSGRQREVLEWVGDGKTTAEISMIMGLKPATVEKHLKKAREALNVATTAQAVMKASLNNQIYVVPDQSVKTPAR